MSPRDVVHSQNDITWQDSNNGTLLKLCIQQYRVNEHTSMNSPNSNKGCASVAAHGLTDLCSNQTVYKGTNWLTCKGHTDGLTDFHRKHIVYVGARLTDWLTQKAQCGCGGAYWLADLHRQHKVYEGHIDWLTDLHRQHYVDVRHTDWLTDLHRQHNVYVGHTDWLTYLHRKLSVCKGTQTHLLTHKAQCVCGAHWLTY